MRRGGKPPDRLPGTYLLRFDLDEPLCLDIGRLGQVPLSSGALYYVGSAFGPGGVAARVHRHVAGTGRPHWHVDRVRAERSVCEVWFSHAPMRLEHAWAERLLALVGAHSAAARFGASDCRCPTHLVHFDRPLSRQRLVSEFGRDGARRWVPTR
jgi:Uri superfamily endonuclease